MLNNIRNFSKTITAKIFLFIIAVPFVFWGMGDVFTSGNTNSLAKINNKNISTQDFIDHINKLNINQNLIKDKIDENILEEVLGRIISNKLIELEIKEANLVISDKMLAEKIKTNINFIDDNQKFSRTKYEKFLISNNLNANEFEKNFKENEFQEELFNYLGGGISSPNFLINNVYENENKKIEVEFINLEKSYLQKDSIKKETPTIEYCRRVFRVGSIFINMTGNHSNSNHLLPNNQGDMNQVNDKIYRKGISMLQKSLNLNV